MKLSDLSAQKESASRMSDAKMEDMMKRMETMTKQTNDMVLQAMITQITCATISEHPNQWNKLNDRKNERRRRKQTRWDGWKIRHAMNVNDDEFHRMQKDQSKRRIEETWFRDDAIENEVETLLISTIIEAGMSKEKIQIKCPAKPITHAFLRFTDSEKKRQIHENREHAKKNKEKENKNITCYGCWGKNFLDWDTSNSAWTKNMKYRSWRSHWTREETRIGRKTDDVQNISRKKSKITQMIGCQKLVVSTVSSRIMVIRRRNERRTSSSHERKTLDTDQQEKQTNG